MRWAFARHGTCCASVIPPADLRPPSSASNRAPRFPETRELNTDTDTESGKPHGPFALTGPVPRPDPRTVPLRGDLAHIALAGRYFVPHYAVPQPRTVMPGGAPLLSATGGGAEEIVTLMEGDSFEVLELAGSWAWGCLSPRGPVGYVHIDRLEQLP